MNLAVVVLAVSVAAGQAGESSQPDERLQEAAWLIGTWKGEYTMPGGVPELGQGGEKVSSTMTWRWALDKRFIFLEGHVDIEGQKPFSTVEITGIEPKSDSVGCVIFNSTGAFGQGEWDRQGDTLTLTWTVTQPDRTQYRAVSYIRPQGPDAYIWEMKNVTRNGQKIPDWGPVTLRRQPAP